MTAVLFTGMAALGLVDDDWPHPTTSLPSLFLLLVVVGVAGAHLTLVRADGAPPTPLRQGVAVAALLAATGGLLLVARDAPRIAGLWLLVPGVALSVLLSVRGWRRADLGVAAVAVVIAAGATTAVGLPTYPTPWLRPIIALFLLGFPAAADLGQIWVLRVFDRLEESRRLAEELATTRERARIAAELHDVQGHSLHAIAMHAELTERLVGTEPEAAARHARTVRTLAADALAETRALVHGYRAADLAGELRNAAGLLRAAGADAEVVGDATAVPAVHAVLLGPVVREAATNVLRHSDPTRVRFTVRRAGDRTELDVHNDGVPDAPGAADPHGGTGLAGVRDRIGKRGGDVEAGPDGAGGFRLRVVLLSGPEDDTEDHTEDRSGDRVHGPAGVNR
ncbi:histidine kinase [Pseudonocardia sp. NPDC049635]|uniref:sensor histidine kinase n=1 Tax=Pseudonocardia sp. NPDC049635 TaxID=3155506 RepID=UPI0033CABAB0